MKGATSAGSFTRRHILSITLAAFLFSTDERPRRALPRRGAIKANVGESTAIRDIRKRDEDQDVSLWGRMEGRCDRGYRHSK